MIIKLFAWKSIVKSSLQVYGLREAILRATSIVRDDELIPGTKTSYAYCSMSKHTPSF